MTQWFERMPLELESWCFQSEALQTPLNFQTYAVHYLNITTFLAVEKEDLHEIFP